MWRGVAGTGAGWGRGSRGRRARGTICWEPSARMLRCTAAAASRHTTRRSSTTSSPAGVSSGPAQGWEVNTNSPPVSVLVSPAGCTRRWRRRRPACGRRRVSGSGGCARCRRPGCRPHDSPILIDPGRPCSSRSGRHSHEGRPDATRLNLQRLPSQPCSAGVRVNNLARNPLEEPPLLALCMPCRQVAWRS